MFMFGGFVLQIESPIVSPCESYRSDGSHKFPAKSVRVVQAHFVPIMYVDTIFTNIPFIARRDPKTRLAPWLGLAYPK